MATKRQHFVPQHYLEAWKGEDDCIAVLTRERLCQRRKLKNVAVVGKIYSLQSVSREDCNMFLHHCDDKQYPNEIPRLVFQSCIYPILVERIKSNSFSQEDIEIVKILLDHELVSDDKMLFLSNWIKHPVRCVDVPTDWNPGAIVEGLEPFMCAIESHFWPTLDRVRMAPSSLSFMGSERVHLYCYIAVQLFRTPRFRGSIINAPPMERLITALDFSCSLVKNESNHVIKIVEIGDKKEFLTCDNPVVPYVLDLPIPELFLPLSPKVGIEILQPLYQLQFRRSLSQASVHNLNELTCENAENEIYATSNSIFDEEAICFNRNSARTPTTTHCVNE